MSLDGRRAIWSPEAVHDLDAIWDYYLRVAGQDTAASLVREIGRAVQLIEDHPLAGRRRDELREGLRSIAAAPHVVFYRVADQAPQIVRVLDGRRDIDDIFSAAGA